MEVTRKMGSNFETVALILVTVVAGDLRLNEPHNADLANIMKAMAI